MEARLQRRVQRYGWDLAAASYEPLWHAQLARAQSEMIARARLARGERVLDVAACNAAFVGGPVALAWSRFDETVRARVWRRYVDSIEPWRDEGAYRIPGEFVIVTAATPATAHAAR